jgi:hypothetical protein
LILTNGDVLGIDIGNVITEGGNEMFSSQFLSARQMPGAFGAIKKLVTEIFGPEKVFLVSKCGVKMQDKTREWLQHHNFYGLTGVKEDHVHFCLERHKKATICQKLRITIFIDDRLEVLGHLTKVDPPKTALYLFKPREQEVRKYEQFRPPSDQGRIMGRRVTGNFHVDVARRPHHLSPPSTLGRFSLSKKD